MPAKSEKPGVLVAMSGGVDSSVCAQLLQQAGYAVRCAVFVFSDTGKSCVSDARSVCETLGLPLEVVDLRARFLEQVVRPFCETYCAGLTPNPCVVCNPNVKFRALCDTAERLGCACIATGHYARMARIGGRPVLQRALSAARDQSYMLYSLTPAQLARLLLPLGALEKPQVRRLALKAGLQSAEAPDSQEICFIPDGDYPAYIHKMGYSGKSGRFLAPDGQPLAPHRGVEYYTVGQRRGLGVALGKPVYIQKILANGDIQLAFSGQEYTREIAVGELCWNPAFGQAAGLPLAVKIRSAARPAPCKLVCTQEKDRVRVLFDDPVRAPAPGQAAVFYSGDYLVGGGVILP